MTTETEVLKTITHDDLEKGLRGVPVGYCTTSLVDPLKGLHYVEHPIADIAFRDPEEVIFLLLEKRWPNEGELKSFKGELVRRQKVDQRVLDSMRALPHRGHPMKWFLHAINAMGMFEGSKDFRDDCLTLIAQIPVVTAAIFRLREEWGDPIPPRDDLGYMENFVHMLGVPGLSEAQNEALVRLLRVFDVLHFDHGGGNLSTFVGKAVASGLADMFESITGAMCGLAGPRHGKANQECLAFVSECIDAVGGDLTEEAVSSLIHSRLDNHQLIYGFGHAVLRAEDPRATVLIDLGDQLCPDDQRFHMVKLLREVVPSILSEKKKVSNPYPNVDLASGSLLYACGLTDPKYYTVLFGMSRVVGIAIQIVYERTEARGGRGTPIIRPKYLYSPKGTSEGNGQRSETTGD